MAFLTGSIRHPAMLSRVHQIKNYCWRTYTTLLKVGWVILSYDMRVTNHALLILVSLFSYRTVRVEGKPGFRSRCFGEMRLGAVAMFDPVAVCFVQRTYTNLIFVCALPCIAWTNYSPPFPELCSPQSVIKSLFRESSSPSDGSRQRVLLDCQ